MNCGVAATTWHETQILMVQASLGWTKSQTIQTILSTAEKQQKLDCNDGHKANLSKNEFVRWYVSFWLPFVRYVVIMYVILGYDHSNSKRLKTN